MSGVLPLPPSGTPFYDQATGAVNLQWQNYLLAFEASVGPNLPPVDAQYWVSKSNSILTDERNLGALASGYLKIATTLGVATPSTVTMLPASDLSGTLPDGVFPTALPVINGALVTNLNADFLATGTVAAARLPTLSMYALLWNTAAIGAGVTTYVGPRGGDTTEVNSVIPIPIAGRLRNLYVVAEAAPGAGETFVYTVRVNGANTAVTATISGAAATTAHDTTHSVAVVAGDLVTISLVTSGSAAVKHHAVGLEGATA